MNRILKMAGLLIALATIPFIYGCEENDFDSPPVKTIDPNSILTISDLRAICPNGTSFTFTGDTSIYAVVSMDESSGNIYKQLYVQDAEQGVELRLTASSRIMQGDSIRVNLKGSTLMYYNNQFQVDNLEVANLVVQESGNDKEPKVVTIQQLLSSSFPTEYQSKLVKIENVQFKNDELGRTFADAINQTTENRYIQDQGGYQIIVRTSGFSSFANALVPEGSGSIIAIATQFGNTRQLIVRKLSEVQMDAERF